MKYQFKTSDLVCSQAIEIELSEDGKTIVGVEFFGGCPGNLGGIAKLVKGMSPEEVIEKLQGQQCGGKPTSCPDQLATALKKILKEHVHA